MAQALKAKTPPPDDDLEDVAMPNPVPNDVPPDEDLIDAEPADYKGLAEVLLRGAGKGVSFGLTEPISAGAVAAVESKALPGSPEFENAYIQERARIQGLEEKFPTASMGAELTTSLLSPVGLEAEAGKLIGKGVEKVGEVAGKYAKEKAFKSLGPYLAHTKAGRKADYIRDAERIQNIGGELLEGGIVKPPASYEAIAERVTMAKEKAGNDIGDILNKATEAEGRATGAVPAGEQAVGVPGKLPPVGTSGVQADRVAADIIDDLKMDPMLPGADEYNDTIAALAQGFSEKAGGSIPLQKAEELKRALAKRINFKKPPQERTAKEAFDVALHDRLRKGVEEGTELLAEQAGGPTKEAFQKAKKTFGAMKEAEGIVSHRIASTAANRMVSPSDYAMGGTGAIMATLTQISMGGSPAQAALTAAVIGGGSAALNNIQRKYGNQILAYASKGVENLAMASPEKFGRFAPVLKQLRNNGPVALSTGIAQLMRDPDFKAQAERLKDMQGIYVDPEDVKMFSDGIMKQEGLNSVQKARIISSLNKEGKLIGLETLSAGVEKPIEVAPQEPTPAPAPRPFDIQSVISEAMKAQR